MPHYLVKPAENHELFPTRSAYKWNYRLNEPMCDQGLYYGFRLTYNPDDYRWHVIDETADGISVQTFKGNYKGFFNMKDWCRREAKIRNL